MQRPLKKWLIIYDNHWVEALDRCRISTGVFGFPQREAAQIAVDTVKEYKAETGSDIKVIFNVFKNEDLFIYRELLSQDEGVCEE